MTPMHLSRRETEIKLRFPSPSEALDHLERLGAACARGREFEDNVLFDFPSRALLESGRLLRLRRVAGRAVLTYKEPVSGTHAHKVRIERETEVADPDELVRILEGLGLAPVYRYQKYRSVFRVEGVEASLDETAIGCYVELEGEPAAIDRVAALLGFSREGYILDSYFDLHAKEAAARGMAQGDLLLDGAPEDRGRP